MSEITVKVHRGNVRARWARGPGRARQDGRDDWASMTRAKTTAIRPSIFRDPLERPTMSDAAGGTDSPRIWVEEIGLPQTPKIVIVDDNESVREATKDLIRIAGLPGDDIRICRGVSGLRPCQRDILPHHRCGDARPQRRGAAECPDFSRATAFRPYSSPPIRPSASPPGRKSRGMWVFRHPSMRRELHRVPQRCARGCALIRSAYT